MSQRRAGGRRALGRTGEDLAVRYLETLGFRILTRNLHLRHAELDVIALERRTLCFIEVRLRRGDRFGDAAASVDRRKQRRLVHAAAEVLATRSLPRHERVRFDVVAIDVGPGGRTIRLIRDAFA
jgi:putative endonuclease